MLETPSLESVLPHDTKEWTEVRKNNAFMNLLNHFEATFPVDQWTVDGVDAWPVARLHLYYSFFPYQYFAREPARGAVIRPLDLARVGLRVLRSLSSYVRATLGDAAHRQSSDHQYDAMFLNYNTYMMALDGAWYSRVCDPLIAQLSTRGRSSLMLTGGYEYSVPRHTKSVFIQPQLVMHRLAGMAARVGSRQSMPELAEIEDQAKSSGLFSKSFKLAGPVEATIKQIRAIARYFRGRLSVVQPKVVFITCWYSTESLACILACHQLGIPCVDIQHGSQGFHVGYARWNRVPASGYNLLPTFFWCWSSTEASSIQEWSARLPTHQPVVGGNLFLERWVRGQDDTVLAYDATMDALKVQSGREIHVLCSMNGSTKDEIGTLAEVIDAANKSGLTAYFWVRMHPIALDQKDEVRTTFSARGITNFDVDNGTMLPLYALLRNVDVHITTFSSVVIEAQAFGVPSVISELGVINFPQQISSGWAIAARTIPEWVSGITHQLSRRNALSTDDSQSSGSSEKVLDELLESIEMVTRN